MAGLDPAISFGERGQSLRWKLLEESLLPWSRKKDLHGPDIVAPLDDARGHEGEAATDQVLAVRRALHPLLEEGARF
jgi:hypothetical protein